MLETPRDTSAATKDETASARELEACIHSVSLSVTDAGAQTAAKRREPCSGAGTAFTGPITLFHTEAYSSTHSWTPLPRRARAGEAFDLAVHADLEGETNTPGDLTFLGHARTTLIEHASGNLLVRCRRKEHEGGKDTRTVRFTFPAPDPRGDGVLRLLCASWDRGSRRARYRYQFVTSAEVERTLKLEAFDGQNDPTREHLPLSLWVTVMEKGKPLAGAPVSLGLSGDLQCLADAYDVWDEGGRDWQEPSTTSSSAPSIPPRRHVPEGTARSCYG